MQNTVVERIHSPEGDRKRQFFQLGRQCRQAASQSCEWWVPQWVAGSEKNGHVVPLGEGTQGSQHHKEPTSLRTAE